MPTKGSGWEWFDVQVTDRDGTLRQVRIVGTCNGSYVHADYFVHDPTGGTYSIPDGSAQDIAFTGGCTEQVVKAWAVAQYPNRV